MEAKRDQTGQAKHHCESWQMLEHAGGGWYCGACGAREASAFDAAREAYEAAQAWLLDLIDRPDYAEPVSEYRAALKAALQAQQRAHKAMMAEWV